MKLGLILNDLYLNIGLTYNPKINVNVNNNKLSYTYSTSNGYEYIKDTILYLNNIEDEIKIDQNKLFAL